ncbi:CgeB family protein [Mesorhizobium sp. L48C026A00]|uniref:CgeB family protein n=1 Tax=Mesorhizobium sp. L48C026A00 TaxID=1287182 RepID=UPI0018DD1B9F|nr:glycosyltransferase [Mesorhizobium sp. L48C026A00]
MKRFPVMVFGGQAGHGDPGAEIASGFREMGWIVQEVNSRHYLGRTSGSISRLLARFSRFKAGQTYRDDLLNVCNTLRPDVFLTVKGDFLTPELLEKIRKTGARTVNYYPDVDFDHPWLNKAVLGEFDLFCTTKRFQIPYLEERLGPGRAAYVPHGYSPSMIRPMYQGIAEDEYRTDVLYAGNHSFHKQEWLESLMLRHPGLGLDIIGGRWNERVASGPLAGCDFLGVRTSSSYAEALQTAKINIAVHFGKTKSGWEDMVSKRTFEIPACRGFMLHIDNEEVREFFEPGLEIDVFASPDELADKVRFYLQRPDLRASMIDRAYRRCVPAYSFRERARQIAERLAL